jgi:hypothetical protein
VTSFCRPDAPLCWMISHPFEVAASRRWSESAQVGLWVEGESFRTNWHWKIGVPTRARYTGTNALICSDATGAIKRLPLLCLVTAWDAIGPPIELLTTRIRFAAGKPHGIALANRAKVRRIKVLFNALPQYAKDAEGLGVFLTMPVSAPDLWKPSSRSSVPGRGSIKTSLAAWAWCEQVFTARRGGVHQVST